MEKATAIIERGNDGTYGIYLKESLQYGLIGDGATVQEAIDDFYGGYEDMREYYREIEKEFTEYEFEFEYDIASFLSYYSKIISFTGLEELTGINKKQLSHYATGIKKPRPNSAKKIEAAIHKLGADLCQVKFA